jgi:hypothetical protein
MARKPRVEFPGALYHLIARVNRRTTLFHDEADYHAYLTRLERHRRRDRLRCYAFILYVQSRAFAGRNRRGPPFSHDADAPIHLCPILQWALSEDGAFVPRALSGPTL